MDVPVLSDKQDLINISSSRTKDVVWKNCREWWRIGRERERVRERERDRMRERVEEICGQCGLMIRVSLDFSIINYIVSIDRFFLDSLLFLFSYQDVLY